MWNALSEANEGNNRGLRIVERSKVTVDKTVKFPCKKQILFILHVCMSFVFTYIHIYLK